MKAKEWIRNFRCLNYEHKQEVLKAIIEELKGKVDECNTLEEIFEKLIKKGKPDKDSIEISKAFKRYQALPEKRQINVRNSIIAAIDEQCKLKTQEEKETKCKEEGHIFGEWEYYSWITKEEGVIDHQRFTENVEHRRWSRICARCGYKEITEYEPEELREARAEKARQEKIKVLEKELDELKKQGPKA